MSPYDEFIFFTLLGVRMGGWNLTPRPNFTVTSEGVVLNQWGLTPPPPDKSNTGVNAESCQHCVLSHINTHKLQWMTSAMCTCQSFVSSVCNTRCVTYCTCTELRLFYLLLINMFVYCVLVVSCLNCCCCCWWWWWWWWYSVYDDTVMMQQFTS